MSTVLTETDAVEETVRIAVKSRVYHADLWEASQRMGSVSAMAKFLGISTYILGKWIKLETIPRLKSEKRSKGWAGRWPEIERKLVEVTGKGSAQLWPGFLKLSGIEKMNKVRVEVREICAGELLALQDRREASIDPVALSLSREHIDAALKTLTPGEQRVVRLRFGFDGEWQSLEGVGRILKISRERVRQLESHALAKLAAHHRREILEPAARELLELNNCLACNALCGGTVFCNGCGRPCCKLCTTKFSGGNWCGSCGCRK